ncbi:MAG: zinc-ribbon domain-containing protein [Actinobacteria bacterium]|nr:zinc-ribbon domain-containing protein [Actinomycetota bacterium]
MGEIKTCKDCNSSFEFIDGEREYFAKQGLVDPKRCPSCRAARKDIEDQQLKCQRCGQLFVYPKELQLYARSYKWDPPTTCLGGCGEDKFQEGYELSQFENKASRILGRFSKYFSKQTDTKSSRTADSKSPPLRPRLAGTSQNPVISNQDVEEFLENKIPNEHLRNVRKIQFSNETKMTPDGPSRGFYYEEIQLIVVNNLLLEDDTIDEYKNTLTHEIGHAALSNLSEAEQDDWTHQSMLAGPVTDRMKDLWYNELNRHPENFAEAYRLYVMDPNEFLQQSIECYEAYQFLLDKVFKGKEYL